MPQLKVAKQWQLEWVRDYLFNLKKQNWQKYRQMPVININWVCHGVAKSRTRLSDFIFTFHFHALEKEMATHSSVLAWRIPGTGEPGGLPSMGSHRVGHDWSDLAAAAAADSRRERQLIIRMKTEKTKNRPRTDSSVQLIALYYLNKPWGHQCVIIQYSKCCSQKWPEFIKKKLNCHHLPYYAYKDK